MGWDAAGRRSQIRLEGERACAIRSGPGSGDVRRRRGCEQGRPRRPGLGLGLVLTLTLLPACSPERLVLFSVQRGPGVIDMPIAKLEVRTSLTSYKPGRHEDTTDDGGNTMFPKTVGVYVHARSGRMTVRVFAYRADDKLVAAGESTVMLEREQTIADNVFLGPCSDPAPNNMTLCQMAAVPDGGDARTDADAGMAGTDAMDAPATDALDGPSNDRSEAGDTLDERTDLVDAFDAPDADLRVDIAPDHTEAGDAPDGNQEVAPDGADAGDSGVIPAACTTYCTALLKACSFPFTGQRQCELSCAFAQLAPPDGSLGDALTCRIDILPGPSASPAEVSQACHSASLLSENCPPGVCFVYCAQGVAECGDQGFSLDDCFANCFGFPVGDVESPRSDDSVACRMSWLGAATDDPGLCARGLPTLPVPCQAQ